MKQTKSILLAAIAAAAVGSASAQPVTEGAHIRIAGSTAMRSVSMNALNTWATGQGYIKVAADNASVGSQQIALYIRDRSTNGRSGVSIVRDAINVRLIGSEGGILTTASSGRNQQGFLPIIGTNSWNTNTGLVPTTTANVTSANCTLQANAAITFADQAQAGGAYNSSKTARLKVASLGAGTQLAALNFAFVAPTNFPANNITSQVARALLRNGHVPLSMFTGNPADATSGVYITGRDIDSGTRVATLVEVGHGVNVPVRQYMVNPTNSSEIILSPSQTLLGLTTVVGNGGYSSGGTLCNDVRDSGTKTFPADGGYTGAKYLIGYSGTPDINSRALKALSYNGVAPYVPTMGATTTGFSTSVNGLVNGSYSFWTTAVLYQNLKNAGKAGATAVPTIMTALGNAITGQTSAQLLNGNTQLTDLAVKRAAEGALVEKK